MRSPITAPLFHLFLRALKWVHISRTTSVYTDRHHQWNVVNETPTTSPSPSSSSPCTVHPRPWLDELAHWYLAWYSHGRANARLGYSIRSRSLPVSILLVKFCAYHFRWWMDSPRISRRCRVDVSNNRSNSRLACPSSCGSSGSSYRIVASCIPWHSEPCTYIYIPWCMQLNYIIGKCFQKTRSNF